MKMTLDGREWEPFDLPPAVQLLPLADQQRYLIDLKAHGFAMVRANDDGSVTYIPPSVWMNIGKARRRRAYLLNVGYAVARSVAIWAIVILALLVLLGQLETPK